LLQGFSRTINSTLCCHKSWYLKDLSTLLCLKLLTANAHSLSSLHVLHSNAHQKRASSFEAGANTLTLVACNTT